MHYATILNKHFEQDISYSESCFLLPFLSKQILCLYLLLNNSKFQGVSRTLHEYQFIPEQPTVRKETYDYERIATSNHYSSLDGIPHARTLLSSGQPLLNGHETASRGYGYQGQMPGLNLLSQQVRQNHLLPSASGEIDNVPRKNPFIDVPIDTHIGAHPVTQTDSTLMPSDKKVVHEEEISRFQRKRKVSEDNILLHVLLP